LILIIGKLVTFGQTTGSHQLENLTTLICSPLPKIKTSVAEKLGQPAMTMLMTCSTSLYPLLHMSNSMNYKMISRL
jgi:hypothetical protein